MFFVYITVLLTSLTKRPSVPGWACAPRRRGSSTFPSVAAVKVFADWKNSKFRKTEKSWIALPYFPAIEAGCMFCFSFDWFTRLLRLLSCTCVHLIDKTLSCAKYKPWKMRHDGILGRQHWQACYSVPYIDIQDIFIPKKVLDQIWVSCVNIISTVPENRSKFPHFQENHWVASFYAFHTTMFFQLYDGVIWLKLPESKPHWGYKILIRKEKRNEFW